MNTMSLMNKLLNPYHHTNKFIKPNTFNLMNKLLKQYNVSNDLKLLPIFKFIFT